MKEGDLYATFAKFEAHLRKFCERNYVLFIKKCSRRSKDPSRKDTLVYDYVHYYCKHSGSFISQATKGRAKLAKSYKNGCKANIFVTKTKHNGTDMLLVKSVFLQHQGHEISPEAFALYPENRCIKLAPSEPLQSVLVNKKLSTAELKTLLLRTTNRSLKNRDIYNLLKRAKVQKKQHDSKSARQRKTFAVPVVHIPETLLTGVSDPQQPSSTATSPLSLTTPASSLISLRDYDSQSTISLSKPADPPSVHTALASEPDDQLNSSLSRNLPVQRQTLNGSVDSTETVKNAESARIGDRFRTAIDLCSKMAQYMSTLEDEDFACKLQQLHQILSGWQSRKQLAISEISMDPEQLDETSEHEIVTGVKEGPKQSQSKVQGNKTKPQAYQKPKRRKLTTSK